MYQLAEQQPPIKPDLIKVEVMVKLQQSNKHFTITLDPEMPFNLFADAIKEQIFAYILKDQYCDFIEVQLQNGFKIRENETRSLEELGFTNQCTLYVRLTLKGSRLNQQKDQTIKVQVEYKMPFNPSITIEEQKMKIKKAIHFDQRELSNVSISSIKILEPQYY